MTDYALPEFYDLVDRYISLANEMGMQHDIGRVSAVIMFAAARYNAHCLLVRDPDRIGNREELVSYLTEQYRTMLEENLDWLLRAADESS